MTSFVNPRYSGIVHTAAAATVLAAGAMFTPWETTKIIGLTVLTGVGYGIANDMIACRDCIEYFTIGHRYDGQELRGRPINTLNPNLNAIVWGMIATWHVCAIAGTVLAAIARVPFPGLSLKISASQLAPYLAGGAVLTMIVAHWKSRAAQKQMIAKPDFKYSVPSEFQAGWEACNTRNSTGYAALALGALALTAAMVAARLRFIKL